MDTRAPNWVRALKAPVSRGRVHHRTHDIAAYWTRTHRNIKADSQVRGSLLLFSGGKLDYVASRRAAGDKSRELRTWTREISRDGARGGSVMSGRYRGMGLEHLRGWPRRAKRILRSPWVEHGGTHVPTCLQLRTSYEMHTYVCDEWHVSLATR
jgi:hypothetical protein